MVDSIVCAAAEAMDVVPRQVRPALLAAFARARRLSLSTEVVEKALGGTGEVTEPAAREKPARRGRPAVERRGG
jgi:hypothetical protein